MSIEGRNFRFSNTDEEAIETMVADGDISASEGDQIRAAGFEVQKIPAGIVWKVLGAPHFVVTTEGKLLRLGRARKPDLEATVQWIEEATDTIIQDPSEFWNNRTEKEV